MQVRIIIGANAYASISEESYSGDVLLSPGRSAAQSLLETAADLRAESERVMRRADRIERAAAILQNTKAQHEGVRHE